MIDDFIAFKQKIDQVMEIERDHNESIYVLCKYIWQMVDHIQSIQNAYDQHEHELGPEFENIKQQVFDLSEKPYFKTLTAKKETLQ